MMVGKAGTPGQGPFMLISLKVDGDRVFEAHFSTYGCPAAQACGRFAAEWVVDKSFQEIATITERIIIEGVGAMPLGREHCPGLAVGAIMDAISPATIKG